MPSTSWAAEPAAASSSPAAVRQYRDAVALQNRGVYDLAADEWLKFLERFSSDPLADKALHYLGVCQLQQKRYEEAQATFEKVIRTYPTLDLLDATYLNLGLTQYSLAQSGKAELYDQAAAAFSTLVSKFPESKQLPQALFYLGESLYARDKKAEAVAVYERLVGQYPKSSQRPDALYALGVAREELDKPAEAAAAYDLFIKEFATHPLRAEVIMRRGETLFGSRQYAEAEKWFASAAGSKSFALADHALMRQAASLYEQKKYPEAASVYASVSQRFPKSNYLAASTLAAGNCYFLSGKLPEAQKWLAAAIAQGGEGAIEAAHWLARTFLKQKQPAEALAVIDKFLPQAGDSAFAANLLMDRADAIYELPGRRGESAALYAEVANSYPQHAVSGQAMYMTALAALGAGDYVNARAYAEKFLEARPDDPLDPDVRYIAAEADLQLNNPAQAETIYRQLLTKNPNHADAEAWKLRLGLALLLEKKFQEVIELVEPLIASLKSADAVAEANYLLGTAHLELKHYEPAVKGLVASLKAQPKWRQADETLLNLAAADRQLNRLPEAIAYVQQVLTDFPHSKLLDRARFRLGEYQYASGNFGAAADSYRAVLAQSGSEFVPNAMYGLGWAQMAQKDYPAAVQTFTTLLEKYPSHALAPRTHYARAMSRQQAGEHAPALHDVEIFLASNPPENEKSDARYVAGLALEGLKKYDEAAQVFQSILEVDGQYSGADKVLYELGWALKSAGKEPESAQAFGRLISTRADSPLAVESQYHVGEMHYQNKDYVAAAKAYADALAKAGKSELAEKAAHKLAWTYFQQGEFDKAQAGFTQQMAAFPEGDLSADAQFMLGESLFKSKKYEQALSALTKSLEHPPLSNDFQVLALLHGGQSAAQLKRWDESSKLLERAATAFPDSQYAPEILYEKGWAKQNQGKNDEAFQLYDQAATQTEREVGARARFRMGEILADKKDYKEAVRNFLKVAGYAPAGAPEPLQKWQASAAFEAGRCFEAMKMPDQAKKSYREVLDNYPRSEKAAAANDRLQALGE